MITTIVKSTAALRVIAKFGGLTAAARTLNKPATTVQRWLEAGYIRPKHHSAILAAALRENVQLDASDFMDVDLRHQAFLPIDARFSAPNTPSPCNTEAHAGASSPHPIPDIAGSPPSDAAQTASGVEEVGGGDVSSSSHPQTRAPVGAVPVS